MNTIHNTSANLWGFNYHKPLYCSPESINRLVCRCMCIRACVPISATCTPISPHNKYFNMSRSLSTSKMFVNVSIKQTKLRVRLTIIRIDSHCSMSGRCQFHPNRNRCIRLKGRLSTSAWVIYPNSSQMWWFAFTSTKSSEQRKSIWKGHKQLFLNPSNPLWVSREWLAYTTAEDAWV